MTPLALAAFWAHLTACALLVGSFFALLVAGPPATRGTRRWEARVVVAARALVLVAIGSGVAWLLLRTAALEGRPEAALEAEAVWRAALDTWAGRVWVARHALLLVLGGFLALRADVAARRDWIAARGEAFGLAALALLLLSGAGHAAATTTGTTRAVAIDAVHLLGAGVWVGALPALALLLHAVAREGDDAARSSAVRAVRRFSRAAMASVVVLLGSGLGSAAIHVGSVAGLVGTTQGRLLVAKLLLLVPILALAALNRRRIRPALPGASDAVRPDPIRRLATFVGLEAGLALALLALAAAMATTTPARHADPVWPWRIRLALDGALDRPGERERVVAGGQLALAGLAALVASRAVRRRRPLLLGCAVILVGSGAGLGLSALVVEAYPTTYQRPPVPYQARSIAAGMAAYRAQCAACHGDLGGVDQGPARLVGPRVERRSAGELFWLVTHGRPERGMPPFASRLDDDRRWDLVNFIRALGAARDAGRIGPEVTADPARLVAPDFPVAVGPLVPRALRDYRGRRMVLLVLYALPESRERMAALARSYGTLSILGVEIVAVPPRATPEAIRALGASPPVLFPVVTEGNAEIVAAYRLLVPDAAHAELLIDRQGYVRAIWRDADEGHPDTEAVQRQVERLNEEPAPPPLSDEHVH